MTPLLPMDEAPDEEGVLVRSLTFDWYDDYWSIRCSAKGDRHMGWLPLPASASAEHVAECAARWLSLCPPEVREKALADHFPGVGNMVRDFGQWSLKVDREKDNG